MRTMPTLHDDRFLGTDQGDQDFVSSRDGLAQSGLGIFFNQVGLFSN